MDPADLGFIELTTFPEGAALFLLAGSFYAIERSAQESFTVIRTATEQITVAETPEEVFQRYKALLEGQQRRVEEGLAEYAGQQVQNDHDVDPWDGEDFAERVDGL